MPPHGGTAFESAALVFDKPLRGDVESILARLLDGVGRPLSRVKGILELEGEACPVVVHGIEGRLYPFARLAAWPEGDRRGRLVAISAATERDALARFLHEFEQAMLA
jgi:G3E family GTPase